MRYDGVKMCEIRVESNTVGTRSLNSEFQRSDCIPHIDIILLNLICAFVINVNLYRIGLIRPGIACEFLDTLLLGTAIGLLAAQ